MIKQLIQGKGQVDEDKPPVDTKEGEVKTADDPREVEQKHMIQQK